MKFHTFLVTLQNSKNTTQKQEKNFVHAYIIPMTFQKSPILVVLLGKKKIWMGIILGINFINAPLSLDFYYFIFISSNYSYVIHNLLN